MYSASVAFSCQQEGKNEEINQSMPLEDLLIVFSVDFLLYFEMFLANQSSFTLRIFIRRKKFCRKYFGCRSIPELASTLLQCMRLLPSFDKVQLLPADRRLEASREDTLHSQQLE